MKEYVIAVITAMGGGLVGMFATYLSAGRKFRDDLEANKQKFRDDLQTKFNESLHNTRVTSYQELWKRLEVLAKYARPAPVTPHRLRKLSEDLRKWYFEVGGLFLTDNSRDAYFALQDAIVDQLAKSNRDDHELSNNEFEAIREIGSNLRTNLSADLRSRKQPDV